MSSQANVEYVGDVYIPRDTNRSVWITITLPVKFVDYSATTVTERLVCSEIAPQR